ncbi:MAG: DNA polymerase III subunit alpha, partial [Dehalococcoidia bacterium]|nr:DNA polymerase III subunit alpha [Dehalococcoidia bacterium]
MPYAELHCHSYYSFHDGASSIEELVLRAKELGYDALALTDHDNLCAALEFARCAGSWGLRPIIGAELTLREGWHLTLLAENHQGYSNLTRLISLAHVQGGRREPALDPELLAEHASGLIALSGCRQGQIPALLERGKPEEARALARRFLDWFGPEGFYLELQDNLCYGDKRRNRMLASLGREMGIPLAATGNAHYHVRERSRLQDALVAVRHCKTLDETHRQRRPNSEFYLRPPAEMAELFAWLPEAVANTREIARRCAFDPSRDLDYRFPDCPVPEGHTPDSYLEELCLQAAVRRYGAVTPGSVPAGPESPAYPDPSYPAADSRPFLGPGPSPKRRTLSREIAPRVRERLDEELRLIRKHGLSGFFLIYHEILKLGREVAVELGLSRPETPLEEDPPGRSRGSSVSLLVGYLIGLSHIDPLKYNLSLERFLREDLTRVPDVDLDFPRNIREGLILKVHQKWGWQHAALTGMFSTYKIRGAVRDLGKALGLPEDEVDKLAKRVEHRSAKHLAEEMESLPDFKDKMEAPLWRHLVDLARELDGFPRYLAQHPGGMVISSRPLVDLVPVQPAAMEGRYICQWDKDSVQDASFIKIDFLALGALSQVQECQTLILERLGLKIDLSRIDYDDPAVYDMLCKGDTIGVFQVESAAQLQTIGRLRPRNLVDMAIEVALVRPGVGATGSTHAYLARRAGKEPVVYDHPLEKRALERTLGTIVFQDQVNQLAIDVAGFSGDQADQLRRAFSRRNNQSLLQAFWAKFRDGAAARGVPEAAARMIFTKFNGQYMFPESHAYAFGVTAYQASWLKRYYPLEFYVAIFNQQPMGFYSLESLKEDARRHGIAVLNPDVNLSGEKCV